MAVVSLGGFRTRIFFVAPVPLLNVYGATFIEILSCSFEFPWVLWSYRVH